MNRLPSKSLLIALPILALLSLPVPSSATSVVMLSDTELILSSRVIVTGKIRSVISAWDDSHSEVWTYVKVRTDRILKGELAARTLVLKQPGGADGGSGIRVFGQPKFTPGQAVLLYLNTGPDGTLHVAHAFMGMFSVAKDGASGQTFVSRSIDAGEVDVLSRRDTDTVTNRAPLNSYIEMIRQTLAGEASRIGRLEPDLVDNSVVLVPPEYPQKKKDSHGYQADFVFLGGGVRWQQPDSGSPVTFLLNSNQSPVAGGGSAEILRAMDAWHTQSGASIRLQVAGSTNSCGLTTDGVNTISFGDCLNQLDPAVNCAGVVAQTRVAWNFETSMVNGRQFNRLMEADVVFNKGMECFLGNSANLAETACHELGHAIGLDHSTDPAAIMWAMVRGHGRDATLAADDIAGVLAMYPNSTGGGGGGQVSITTGTLPSGVVNHAYGQTLSATGGTPPYRWSLTGGFLPTGLSLSTGGVINGTPSAAGSFSIVVMVTDSVGGTNHTSVSQLSLFIASDSPNPTSPAISRVRVKGSKKLRVFGQGFSSDAVIWLNGTFLTPREFTHEGTEDVLFYKGRLSLGSSGSNTLYVKNSVGWSGVFSF